MLSFASTLLLAASIVVSAHNTPAGYGPGSSPFPPFSGNPFQEYSLSANGINATFIPYGARLTNLFVKDKNGKYQVVVLGYDNATQHLVDTETRHTYFGPIVGRYANRYDVPSCTAYYRLTASSPGLRMELLQSMVKPAISPLTSTVVKTPCTAVS